MPAIDTYNYSNSNPFAYVNEEELEISGPVHQPTTYRNKLVEFHEQDIVDGLTPEEIEWQYTWTDINEFEEKEKIDKANEKKIEKTKSIFTSALLSISDGIKHENLDMIDGELDIVSLSQMTTEHFEKKNYRINYHQKEVGFFDDSNFDQPVNFKYVILSITSILLKVFLGIENYYIKQKQLDCVEMLKLLTLSKANWHILQSYYNIKFEEKINKIIDSATDLIKFRSDYNVNLFRERMFLVSQISLAGVAKLMDKRNYMIMAIAGSIVTSVGMLVHYGLTSIKGSKKSADLRNSVEAAYHEAPKYRIIK